MAVKSHPGRHTASVGDGEGPLTTTAITESFPLSANQKSLWLMQQMLPESTVYHIALAVRILGQPDVSALQSALQAIVNRHASLRTVFSVDTEGRLKQNVRTLLPIPLETIETPGFSDAETYAAVDAEYRRPFDLTDGPLIRAHLFSGGAGGHVLLVNAHHLVLDVLSLVLVFTELTELYESGRPDSLRPVRSGYRDFVEWQNQMLAGPEGKTHLDFWRGQLEGAPQILDLPTDHARPSRPSARGRSVDFGLESDLVQRLKTLADVLDVHLYDIFAAVWQILLCRYAGQEDILIGFVTGGRPQLRFARTAGLFSNPIALRGRLADNPPFSAFVRRQRETLAECLAHHDYPFALMAEALQTARVPGYMPLFQVLFNYYKVPRASQFSELFVIGPDPVPVQAGALVLQSYRLKQEDIEFDLSLEIAEGKRCRARMRYSADLFDPGTIERIGFHYVNLLRAVVADASRTVLSLPLLSEAERDEILLSRNRTQADFPRDITACQLFEAKAAEAPDRIAAVCGSRQLTYAGLNARAGSLAAYLRACGVGRGSLVGVCMERSADMPVALLAVWKAGAAYVPLDPHFPKARLDLILEDAAPRMIVTETALAGLFTPGSATVVELDGHEDRWAAFAAEPSSALSGSDLAYVLYTSGSTGKPKGVEIPHSAFTNFLLSMRKRPGLGRDDVLLAVTTFSFDIAGLELFLPLITGAKVAIATRETALDGKRLAREIEARAVTVMQATPATWRLLVDSDWSGEGSLKALCGGEALPRELALQLLPRVGSLCNMYGPTETTVWSAMHEVGPTDDPIPLGAPIDNTTLYILDAGLQPVPAGVAGELHIGGAGLARGYRNLPDLTASRFIAHPFVSGERLYKTGDLCRRRADGAILFLGRLDDQVKVRGHRIELGEIESVLLRQPAVREAAAVINESPGSAKRLVAYLVAPAGVPPATPAVLREFLSTQLPEYMTPASFVYLGALPLTPNAKVDRKALRSLAVEAETSQREYRPPRTPTEAAVAALWAEMLKTRVGILDRFDELGGDSLHFALMTVRAGKKLGIPIPVRMDGDMLSVAGFARAADRIAGSAPSIVKPIAPSFFVRPEPLTRTWYGRMLVKTCAALVRRLAHVEVDGLENVPREGPAILAGNHISLFDFAILATALESPENGRPAFPLTPTFIIASKWRWLARPFARQLGHTIYVRRGEGDMHALRAALEVLADKGAVAIMPEGRPTRGALSRAKPGVAFLAEETGAPVWPLAIFGHDRIFDFWPRLRKVPVKIRLGRRLVLNNGDCAEPDLQRQADSVMKAIAALMPHEYHGVYSQRTAETQPEAH